MNTSDGIRYKCPICGATCRTSHCFDCDKDIPMSSNSTWHERNPLPNKSTDYYDINVSGYISVDDTNKCFKIKNDSRTYSFSELIKYELYENNSVIQKGGVGRAIVGGALFGDVGAIVGAQTRKSENVVDALYIRLALKSVGMRKIVFISSETKRNSIFYKSAKQTADEVMSRLDIILSKNQTEDETPMSQEQAEPLPPEPQPKTQQPVLSVADELLKLKQLLDMGVLTEEEFNQQKQKLLNS